MSLNIILKRGSEALAGWSDAMDYPHYMAVALESVPVCHSGNPWEPGTSQTLFSSFAGSPSDSTCSCGV